MDLATVVGFVVAMGLVIGGALVEGLHVSSLFGGTAFMIVVGGSLGATVMSHTKEDLKHVASATKKTIFPTKLDFAGTIDYIVNLAEKARRGGLLGLQEDIPGAPHPLLQVGLNMTVDGSDPEAVREVLTSMVRMQEEGAHHAAAVWDTAGGYSPTLGIMGTVMGLIHVMGNLSEPDTLGPAIAVAFLATFYGVAFANIVYLPLGSKIKLLAAQEALLGQLMIEGVIGLQTGTNPRTLKERLTVYMGAHNEKQNKGRGRGADAAEGSRAV